MQNCIIEEQNGDSSGNSIWKQFLITQAKARDLRRQQDMK